MHTGERCVQNLASCYPCLMELSNQQCLIQDNPLKNIKLVNPAISTLLHTHLSLV